MTQTEKEKLKKKIIYDIEALQKQIETLHEKAKPITPDCSLGRLTRMEAMAEQEVSQKILDESTLRLTRLQNALSRIDKPMFGICIECEEPIGMGRMEIRPESVRCIACANEQ
jgi:DnaK suppressor protein